VENQTNPRWRSDYGGKFKWKNILSSAEGFWREMQIFPKSKLTKHER
jgi:hypothetical protein